MPQWYLSLSLGVFCVSMVSISVVCLVVYDFTAVYMTRSSVDDLCNSWIYLLCLLYAHIDDT